MGKYRARTVVINGKYYTIENLGKDNSFVWVVLLALIFFLYQQVTFLFHMPSEADFASDKYRQKAEEMAEELLMATEKKLWVSNGFVERTHAPKAFVLEAGMKFGDIAERTKYLGNGVYQIYTKVNSTLSATSDDDKTTVKVLTIYRETIVTIEATPRRSWYGTVNFNWTITRLNNVKISPDTATIKQKIENWKVPPSKQPNW